MTEQLKTLMDRAADRDFTAVDLDAIISAGHRTVRRRRIATGVADVAVLAVVGATAFALGGDGDQKADFVDDPSITDVAIWTEGSTLHTPDRSWKLGVDVATLVRTSEGIVYLGWDGMPEERLGVYFFSGEGEPTQIGMTQDWHLVADPDQPYVGWLDSTEDDLEAVIYDVSRGERIWGGDAEPERSSPIVAIDGSQAYLASADQGPVRILDLASGDVREAPDNKIWRNFVAAEGDLVARNDDERSAGDDRGALEVGPVDADPSLDPGRRL